MTEFDAQPASWQSGVIDEIVQQTPSIKSFFLRLQEPFVHTAGQHVDVRLLDSGAVRVAVDSTYPLSEAAVAHERAEAGHIQGKIVLAVGDAIADQSGQAGVPSVQWPPRMRGH